MLVSLIYLSLYPMLITRFKVLVPSGLLARRLSPLGIILLGLLPMPGFSQPPLASCRAVLKNDTLTLENNQIARRFRWNNGQLITLSLTDKQQSQTWQWASQDPDCVFPGHSMPTGTGTLETKQIIQQPNQTDHLEVSVTTQLGTLELRRVFAIYPAIAALNCTFYLRGKPSEAWQQAVKQAGGSLDFRNIESQQDMNRLTTTTPTMDKLALAGNHWRARAIEFTDMTDRNNTLVTEKPYNLYRQPGFLRGNLLWLTDGLTGSRLFVLKEAPTSAVQLANPGFDFMVKAGSIQTVGVGILPTDLLDEKRNPADWLRGYGYTLGLGGASELACLRVLRSYQDAKHPRQPDRDEMILMNTWGDRSQDKKVGEAFTIEELRQAARLGVTHLQLDDGWQTGRSANSAFKGGSLTAIWRNPNYWKPNPERFPNGLKPVLEVAKQVGVEIGLWFNPSIDSSFQNWKSDAQTLIGLYRDYGVRIFKIDGVQINDKAGEVNFRHFIDSVLTATNYAVAFNMDVTAGRRNGYHYFNEYGNLFLENRYTDWGNYYPYCTLRNLWDLSNYVPPQNLQIEFLNKWRNADKYPQGDRFAPANYSFDYLFASTMAAQPLAWFEGTGLPAEAMQTAPLIKTYRHNQRAFHSGQILPIGDEPSGKAWTGFQSIVTDKEGFLLVFREYNDLETNAIKTWLPAGKRVQLQPLAGNGKATNGVVTADNKLTVSLPERNSFGWFRYKLVD